MSQNAFARPYIASAYNNAWANHRLLSVCEVLGPGEFAAIRTSFFPSLAATLNHNYTVDIFYVDALEGGTLGLRAFEPEQPYPDAGALRNAHAALDRRLIAHCTGLDGSALSESVIVDRGDHKQIERRDRLLLHLFQHQIHHRGQAHAMLTGTSVKPPQLDEFFAVGEAHLRAADFAALGWTEAEVWGDAPSARGRLDNHER